MAEETLALPFYWVIIHIALFVCGAFKPDRVGDMGIFAAAAHSFLPTVLVFALVFLTASIVRAFCRWAHLRTGRVIASAAMVLAYAIGLGALAASILFAYPVGFTTHGRLAFVGFAVVTCGLLSLRKQLAA